MSDLRDTDELIRAWIRAAAPPRAPRGLLEGSLARTAGVAPQPRRPSIAGVPRVWLAVAATLGLVITTIIGMALASEASRRDVSPWPAPSVEAASDRSSLPLTTTQAPRPDRFPSATVADRAVIRR
jgi:hypothetical protein